MAIVRIFQIAKELNISHTDIVDFLNKKGLDVKSHMSPVDDEVRNLIMSEFSKDKMLVDRFRKEQVRKEIHDTRLKEKQESQKKLQLLSLQDQRDLEKKEKLKTIYKKKINLNSMFYNNYVASKFIFYIANKIEIIHLLLRKLKYLFLK